MPQGYVYYKSTEPCDEASGVYYYKMELVAYNQTSRANAKKAIMDDLSIKSSTKVEFSQLMLTKMTHGPVTITFNLLDCKTEPIFIGSGIQKKSLNDKTVIKVPVPAKYKSSFENDLKDRSLSGELVFNYNSRNISISSLQYNGRDIVTSEYFKSVLSSGAQYFNYDQVQDIVKNSFKQINVTAYRDLSVPNELNEFTEKLFQKCFDLSQNRVIITENQFDKIDTLLLNGSGINPSEFKPTRILRDKFQELKDVTDH